MMNFSAKSALFIGLLSFRSVFAVGPSAADYAVLKLDPNTIHLQNPMAAEYIRQNFEQRRFESQNSPEDLSKFEAAYANFRTEPAYRVELMANIRAERFSADYLHRLASYPTEFLDPVDPNWHRKAAFREAYTLLALAHLDAVFSQVDSTQLPEIVAVGSALNKSGQRVFFEWAEIALAQTAFAPALSALTAGEPERGILALLKTAALTEPALLNQPWSGSLWKIFHDAIDSQTGFSPRFLQILEVLRLSTGGSAPELAGRTSLFRAFQKTLVTAPRLHTFSVGMRSAMDQEFVGTQVERPKGYRPRWKDYDLDQWACSLGLAQNVSLGSHSAPALNRAVKDHLHQVN